MPRVPVDPVADDLPVPHLAHGAAAGLGLPVRRGDAHELARMRPGRRPPDRDVVAARKDPLEVEVEVGERPEVHLHRLARGLTARHRPRERVGLPDEFPAELAHVAVGVVGVPGLQRLPGPPLRCRLFRRGPGGVRRHRRRRRDRPADLSRHFGTYSGNSRTAMPAPAVRSMSARSCTGQPAAVRSRSIPQRAFRHLPGSLQLGAL